MRNAVIFTLFLLVARSVQSLYHFGQTQSSFSRRSKCSVIVSLWTNIKLIFSSLEVFSHCITLDKHKAHFLVARSVQSLYHFGQTQSSFSRRSKCSVIVSFWTNTKLTVLVDGRVLLSISLRYTQSWFDPIYLNRLSYAEESNKVFLITVKMIWVITVIIGRQKTKNLWRMHVQGVHLRQGVKGVGTICSSKWQMAMSLNVLI